MALYRGIVFGAYVVFLCNMAISYYHAWEFFHHLVGFPGLLAHVAVVGIDTVFALSTLVISTAIMKKIPIGFPVWLCFVFGFGFTEWSNVRACWSDGLQGIIAGSSVPMALLCIKFLLAWMVANREAFMKVAATTRVAMAAAANTTTNQVEATNDETDTATKADATNEPDTANQVDTATNEADSVTTKADVTTNEADSVTTKVGDTNETDTTNQVEATNDETDTATKADATNEPDTSTKVGDTANETDVTTKVDITKEKKERHLRLVEPDGEPDGEDDGEPDLEYIKKKAKEYEKENGKLPGRTTLMRIAGCRQNRARRALDELKGKAS